MIPHGDPRYNSTLCAMCKRPFWAHDRANDECFIWQRSSPEGRPYGMKRRRVPVKGWKIGNL